MYRQGMSFLKANLHAQAAEIFEQLTDAGGLQGHLGRYYHALACRQEAEQQMSAGNYPLAATYLEKALQSNPNSPTLLAFIGECFMTQGQYGQADSQVTTLADVSENPDQVKLEEALSHYLAGRSGEAIEILLDLSARHPGCFETNFHLGTILAAEGDSDRAIRYLTESCALRPENSVCQWRLALSHVTAGHAPEAFHHLQQAHKLDPGNNWILSHLTMAANQAKHYGLEVQVEIVPVDQVQTGLADPSLDQLAELIAKEPEFVSAFLDLPQSELDKQIFSVLLEILMRALEAHPEFADLHYHCSCVHQRLGQTVEAIAHSQEALNINPRYVNALIHLAKLYTQTDQHQKAIDRLQSAISNGANYADVHYVLGKLYQQTGAVDQARLHYRRALSINGEYNAAKEALAVLAA